MESEIFKVAATQGIWACLAVFLIFYIIKAQEKRDIKQDEREKKYQEIVSELTEELYIVKDLKENIEEFISSK